MSISLRLLLGFGLSMLMMLAIGLFSLNEIGDVRDTNDAVVNRDIAASRQLYALQEAHAEMGTLRIAAVNAVLQKRAGAGSAEAVDAAIADWTREAATAATELDSARRLVSDFADHRTTGIARQQNWIAIDGMLAELDGALRQVRTDTGAYLVGLRDGDDRAVQAEAAMLGGDRGRFAQQLDRVRDALDQSVQLGRARIATVYQTSVWSVAAALLGALLVSVTVSLLVRRAVIRPIGSFVGVAERIGAGDLSARAPPGGAGEMARLGAVLNRMAEGLQTIATRTREATGNLNVSVAEIRASTQQQAAGVEEQLAAVQETAATVDEIAHSGAQISRRAQEVIASAQATRAASDSGLDAVRESGRAMEQIQQQGEAVAANIVALSEKTEAIGEIVGSVNDIAERSHLLALNAAIEAASAGEHGRSFAVVASEMKILADQAREATAQVRTILGDIQRGINTSVMLTEEAVKRGAAGRARTETAEETIEEMAAGIQDAVHTFQQIVASTNQQQLGIEQVMVALQNIRQASQQTASGTRQLDTAALGLNDLSRQLLSTAERFRV